MAESAGLLGVGWGALTGLSFAFMGLLAWRARQHAAAAASAIANSAAPIRPIANAGLVTFDSQSLTVEHEVAGALSQLQDIVQRRQVELTVAVQPMLTLWANSCALQQIFVGVLVQAIERAQGGAVLLSAGWHGGRVQLTIMDDGPASDRAALIGRLRDVAQYVALQGGTLEVECRPPRGNRVVLRLPGTGAAEVLATEEDLPEQPTVRDAPWTGVMGAA
jgi:hypothetical protein